MSRSDDKDDELLRLFNLLRKTFPELTDEEIMKSLPAADHSVLPHDNSDTKPLD